MKKEGLCAVAHCNKISDITYGCVFDGEGCRIHIDLCAIHWNKLPEGWEAAANYLVKHVPGSTISIKKTIERNEETK